LLHRTCGQWSIKRPQEAVVRGSGSYARLPAQSNFNGLALP
jgi:hypothetical protein